MAWKRHHLIKTLRELDGNARGAVYTEPLWGIPFNLYAPYVSVYMLALGVTDAQVGMIATISTAVQVLWTLLGGAITDKMGRKRTTLIFDLVSWSVPCVIWALAQDIRYFLVAAIINSVWRVTHCSWSCLLVEDTKPDLLVDVYSWVYISGLLAAFVAPLAGMLIGSFGLVPTMRGLYGVAAVMMASKAVTMNALVVETTQGRVRMNETADQGLLEVLSGSGEVLRQISRSPQTLYTLVLMMVFNVVAVIRASFWPILVSQEIGVRDGQLAIYPVVRSLTMLFFFFGLMPKVRRFVLLGNYDERIPMMVGFGLFGVSQLMLTLTPVGATGLLLVATIVEGCGIPLATTFLDKMTVTTVDPEERARILSLLTAIVLVGSSPFGWLAGQLSAVNRRLPFVLVAVLLVIGMGVTYLATRAVQREVRLPAALTEEGVPVPPQ